MRQQTAVIVPVYNAVRSLELVLTGYCRQSLKDFALLIADDGSGPEVKALAEAFSRRASYPIQYVRQPDEGFRRSRVLNEAVRASAASYLIFADADCIPHANFVAAHLGRAQPRTVLCGRRVLLSERVSAGLTPQEILAGTLERYTPARLIAALLGKGGHWDEGLLLRNRTVHGWVNNKEPTLMGCNFSMARSLLEEINGFNEDFIGYGGEDTELECRLRRAGARFRWVRHLAIQYHLYHPVRAGNQANVAALERTLASAQTVCANGLRRISDPRPPTSDLRPLTSDEN